MHWLSFRSLFSKVKEPIHKYRYSRCSSKYTTRKFEPPPRNEWSGEIQAGRTFFSTTRPATSSLTVTLPSWEEIKNGVPGKVVSAYLISEVSCLCHMAEQANFHNAGKHFYSCHNLQSLVSIGTRSKQAPVPCKDPS